MRTLARASLPYNTMSSRTTRPAVDGCLPAQIRSHIEHEPDDLIDVINIANTAASLGGGLRNLIDLAPLLEGNTYAIQEVDHLAASFA